MNLNVGCGKSIIDKPDWINLDPYIDDPKVVKVPFLDYVKHLSDNLVDNITMEAILEHTPRLDNLPIFKESNRILRPGGSLNILVPDFDYTVEMWTKFKYEYKEYLEQQFYGNQIHEGEYHRTIWTMKKLQNVLDITGFTEFVSGYTWAYAQRCIKCKAIKSEVS
jgi:predicted SAM-dependent methyltransferase